jgi:hypothetical protein
MKIGRMIIVIISLTGLITSCSGGSNSGGGGQSSGGNDTVPVTYSEADLEGTWQFSATQITSGGTMTGTMSFNNSLLLTSFDTSNCPGQPISYSEWWYLGDGWVKGRVFGFCNEPDVYIKFGVQFSNKYTMAGDMDVHYAFPGTEETYQRYSITLTKSSPKSSTIPISALNTGTPVKGRKPDFKR